MCMNLATSKHNKYIQLGLGLHFLSKHYNEWDHRRLDAENQLLISVHSPRSPRIAIFVTVFAHICRVAIA